MKGSPDFNLDNIRVKNSGTKIELRDQLKTNSKKKGKQYVFEKVTIYFDA